MSERPLAALWLLQWAAEHSQHCCAVWGSRGGSRGVWQAQLGMGAGGMCGGFTYWEMGTEQGCDLCVVAENWVENVTVISSVWPSVLAHISGVASLSVAVPGRMRAAGRWGCCILHVADANCASCS